MTKANLSRLSDFNYSSSMTDPVSREIAISNLVYWKMLALSVGKVKISDMHGKSRIDPIILYSANFWCSHLCTYLTYLTYISISPLDLSQSSASFKHFRAQITSITQSSLRCLLKETNVETRHLTDDRRNLSLLILFLFSPFSYSLRLPADNSSCIAVSTNGFFRVVLAQKVEKQLKLCRRVHDRCRGESGCKKRMKSILSHGSSLPIPHSTSPIPPPPLS